MLSIYLLCVSFMLAAFCTLVIGVGRRDDHSARETGTITIEDETKIDIPRITAVTEKAQPWKDWLQAEMATSNDPSRPWLDWKPDMDDPSNKPWLHWSKRKFEQGGTGVEENIPKPTTEMMGTYPVVNLARIWPRP